ncbi:PaaI family thioesterase [Tropicibacter naphthalenivorans]|uniref:Putative esterase/MT1895 n=1 Tax=Tropicibacter naphthalenivorans TaxID=441103 RepID=A0A0P1GGT4_9RHOB|nr:PaaI family thioesterase [Tropicibacter naphthalenivorans]CUH81117.1 Putative esterase/MT1895 [Tropicibacter naphthalenivorans]SMC97246.1 uncharacterized domain 1-containing protein [Tropicibacter naphthalenivorans]
MTDQAPALDAQQTATGFNLAQGFEATEWTPGQARGRVTIRPEHLNSQGIVHGGVYCAFLDFASGLCGTCPDETDTPDRCMTLSLTTNFLAPATGGTLTVTAQRTGGGRSIYYAEARITDETGRTLATSLGTFKYIRARD